MLHSLRSEVEVDGKNNGMAPWVSIFPLKEVGGCVFFSTSMMVPNEVSPFQAG